ncbi:MAG: NAD(P)-dependent alcohol dehydrogenase [Nannocystales bacterium]
MRAVVFHKYGPPEVLAVEEVAKPTPKADEILIRVHASTVSAEDPKMRSFNHPPMLWIPIAVLFGYPRPRTQVLGMELSGTVEAVGRAVTRFQVGDAVFGYTGVGLRAHAEYRCLPENSVLTRKPDSVSFTDAAAVPNSALTALVYLRNMGKLVRGERVLIYGASGAVGSAAVQIAKSLGADVTGVCSTRNVQLVRSLGADHVVDYTCERFTDGGRVYDVVFDTIGKTSFGDVRSVLDDEGRYLVTVFGVLDLLRMLWTRLRGGPRVLGGASNLYWKRDDLELLVDLMAEGSFRAVVDRCYPMTAAIEAHRYVETGRKRGNVVLQIRPEDAGG